MINIIGLNTSGLLVKQIHHDIESTSANLHNRSEPSYIASLVLQLPSKLKATFRIFYPNATKGVSGCFIHQKPLAKFCDNSLPTMNPEIGDLLIVFRLNNGAESFCNSLLLQAKKAGNVFNKVIPQNEMHQFLLYSRWPKFKYMRAGAYLNDKIRSITPKTITPGAQYLLIDEHSETGSTYWCASPKNTSLSASKCLASEIIDLLQFQGGRSFSPKRSSGNDHWTQLIWDLLKIAYESNFNLRCSGCSNATRSYGDDLLSCLLNEKLDNNSAIPTNEEAIFDELGMGVICIGIDVE